jgi:hypothetical protein
MMQAQRREPPCLSDLRLDQLLAGELSGETERLARAHLGDCVACEQRRISLAADRQSFAEQAPDFQRLMTPKRPRRAQVAAFVLSAAALLVLGVGLELGKDRQLGGSTTSLATRTKGGTPVLELVVRRGDQSFWYESGQALHPADQVRFTVSSAQPLHVGVWGIDALGRASSYHGSAELSNVEAGVRQPLPGAVELDESLGEERLVAVFCLTTVPGAELAAAITRSPGAPSLPAECTYQSLGIVKVLP